VVLFGGGVGGSVVNGFIGGSPKVIMEFPCMVSMFMKIEFLLSCPPHPLNKEADSLPFQKAINGSLTKRSRGWNFGLLQGIVDSFLRRSLSLLGDFFCMRF